MARRYDLEDRLIRFGADVCRLAEQLPSTVIGKHVAHQVIRSGTSPIGQYGEAQGAESRRDFVHKLGMCLKDLRETGALIAIVAVSIRTARRNQPAGP